MLEVFITSNNCFSLSYPEFHAEFHSYDSPKLFLIRTDNWILFYGCCVLDKVSDEVSGEESDEVSDKVTGEVSHKVSDKVSDKVDVSWK